jgi:general secretion pathway protein C
MLIVLHSFYRPICLTLLAILGLACGHLIDTVLQMNLRPEFAAESVGGEPAPSQQPRIAMSDLNLILQHNIFDANNRSASASMGTGLVNAEGVESEATAPRADIKLIGTVVAGEDSQTLLEIDRKLELYHLGEQVPGGGTVEEIRRTQVKIRNRDQSVTVLTLYEQAPLDAGSRPAADETGKPGPKTAFSKQPETGGEIREVGENQWLVSREMVESARENFSAQLRLAQMQPRLVDGKTDGFLIQRINPRSLLAKLGLKRGDVVIDVNNIKLDSPEKALMIFQQLREARQIGLSIERNGSPMTFSYEIE